MTDLWRGLKEICFLGMYGGTNAAPATYFVSVPFQKACPAGLILLQALPTDHVCKTVELLRRMAVPDLDPGDGLEGLRAGLGELGSGTQCCVCSFSHPHHAARFLAGHVLDADALAHDSGRHLCAHAL